MDATNMMVKTLSSKREEMICSPTGWGVVAGYL